MNSINVVMPSNEGITAGIGVIIKLIKDHPESFVRVLHLYKEDPEDDSTFIAFFREPYAIGRFTAVVNAWGSSYGYRGAGPLGYGVLMSLIDDNDIELDQREWKEFIEGTRWEKHPFDRNSSVTSKLQKWEELLVDCYYFSLCDTLPSYPYTFDDLNENWKKKWNRKKSP